jgi:hypothetical protein
MKSVGVCLRLPKIWKKELNGLALKTVHLEQVAHGGADEFAE